jgi:hypothetical protein
VIKTVTGGGQRIECQLHILFEFGFTFGGAAIDGSVSAQYATGPHQFGQQFYIGRRGGRGIGVGIRLLGDWPVASQILFGDVIAAICTAGCQGRTNDHVQQQLIDVFHAPAL